MAEGSLVKVDEPQIQSISLGKILDAFNGPLNEEQAWALCHQCAKFLNLSFSGDGDNKDFILDGIDAVSLRRDGTVTIEEQAIADNSTDERSQERRERELVDALGRVIYQSLDYGFNAEEERELSQPLESLIDSMTISDDTDDKNSTSDTLNSDEGIEDGTDDELDRNEDGKLTNFTDLLQTCRQHIADPSAAQNHYQAVCRALVNEVQELTTFLERLATSKQTIRALGSDGSGRDLTDGNVDELKPKQWARIWMMVLQDLRHGVQLKKVTERQVHKTPIEFEFTPYEILMDDIRSRRYQLNKIMVNGDIPPRVKREAHDIILDFIRSRPPLKPVRCHSWSDSKLMDRPDIDKLRKISHHERLLLDIQAKPQLQPVSQRVLAKKRPKLRSRRRRFGSGSWDSGSMSSDWDSESSFDDSPELPKRKLKAEVILDWSDDDDMLDTVTIPSSMPTHYDSGDVFSPPSVKNNMYVYPERPKDPAPPAPRPRPTVIPRPPSKKLSAIHLPSLESDPGTPEFSTLPPGVSSEDMFEAMQEMWLDNTDLLDDEPVSPLKGHARFTRDDPRRHSIGGCQSQRRSLMKKSKSSTPTTEFNPTPAHLSLTVDEVIHIRTVLVKAEMENLRVNPKLYQAVAAEKVCFACKIKFQIFKKKLKCKLCQRLVCSNCCKKMHLPKGHFLQIPVDALSPAPPKRRRKKHQSEYRGEETAEKFRSISEPPTPSMSPIHIPKFWRTESSVADNTEDVCVMCHDFLLNALKSAQQKTPTPSPNRTPIRTPSSRTPSLAGSEQSTPTRKFSLGPAPNPPGLYKQSDNDVTEYENSSNQTRENGLMPKVNSLGRFNNNDEIDVIDDIECMTICDDPNKPWGVNNDDEELEEVRQNAPQERRIPYII